LSAAANNGPALLLEGVSKHYAGHTAVDSLSLDVRRGSIHGILGPNGAGKSTTLRMIMNIIFRDSGRLLILGRDPERDRGVLRDVGYLPEERGLYKRMTVLETIGFFGRLKGLSRSEAAERGTVWLERLGLEQWAGERVEALSKGMQQKVQLITTLIHEPDLLILDEPQSGLDPVNQEVLADTIRAASRGGRTVLLSTHNMAQAEALCDDVTLIADGRKVLEGTVRGLRSDHRSNRFRLELDHTADPQPAGGDGGGGDGDAEEPPLRTPGLIQASRRTGHQRWELELMAGRSREELLRALLDARLPVTRFEHVEPSLHEIFIQHVGAAAPHADRKEMARA
jgi:ABC-2 type transport system ATP-binding protein